jgi:hypothetical protein
VLESLDSRGSILEKEGIFLKDWITKDYDSRRSWIGGEGIPSRDLGQRKRENKCAAEGLTTTNSAGILVQVVQNNVSFSIQVTQIDTSANNMSINVTVTLFPYKIIQ